MLISIIRMTSVTSILEKYKGLTYIFISNRGVEPISEASRIKLARSKNRYFSRSLTSYPWRNLSHLQYLGSCLHSQMFPCTSSGLEVFHFPSSVFFWLYQGDKRGFLMLMWWTVRKGILQKWKIFSVLLQIPRWNFYQHRILCVTDEIPKIESSVGEDSSNWDWKSIVESRNTIFFEYFCTTVNQTIELSLCFWFSDISSQSCSCKIKGIDEDQTETSCNTSWKEWS